jgi:hypothetical protein
LLIAGCVAALAQAAAGADIYMLSSGDPGTDAAAMTALTSRGHAVMLGVEYTEFDGSVNLAPYQTVYLQANFNWSTGLMPAAGQQQLVDWVNGGGRLVTSEWVVYYTFAGGGFEMLGAIIPVVPSTSYGGAPSAVYTVVTADPVLNAGLPSQFTVPLTSFAGTETYSANKPAARMYYSTSTSAGAAGLAGWTVGLGSVYSFTSTCGSAQVADMNFGRLFSNVMGPATGTPCYANCDGSTTAPILNVNDFICFQGLYAAGHSSANCDGSTAPPVLNVNDFICFQGKYAAGCP